MSLEKSFQDYFCDDWKGVIDSMKEGLMLVDPSGRILFVNNALEKMLGYEKDEMVGKPCDIL